MIMKWFLAEVKLHVSLLLMGQETRQPVPSCPPSSLQEQ